MKTFNQYNPGRSLRDVDPNNIANIDLNLRLTVTTHKELREEHLGQISTRRSSSGPRGN